MDKLKQAETQSLESQSSQEDSLSSSGKRKRGTAKETEKPLRKSARIKKQQKEEEGDNNDGDWKPEKVKRTKSGSKAKSTTAKASQSSQEASQSQDALDSLKHQYADVSTQEVSMEIYKRNKPFFLPLGKISPEQIEQGKEVLDKIKQLLEKKDKSKKKYVDLSNQFYTIIPSQDRSDLPTINTDTKLTEKYRLLESFSTK